ncbi:hypothetical protein ACFQ0M_35995 [Kitasatospora aburaviensis]
MGERSDHPQGPGAAEDSGAQEIEATVVLGLRITNWPALRAAAIAAVEELDFEGIDPAGQRRELLREVAEDANAALGALLHPDRLVAAIPGVEAIGGTLEISVTEDFAPDFAELFPLEGDEEDGGAAGDWTLTPRTACLLHAQLLGLADAAYDDLEEHQDEPVVDGEEGTGRSSAVCRSAPGGCTGPGAGRWPAPSTTSPTTSRSASGRCRAVRPRRSRCGWPWWTPARCSVRSRSRSPT